MTRHGNLRTHKYAFIIRLFLASIAIHSGSVSSSKSNHVSINETVISPTSTTAPNITTANDPSTNTIANRCTDNPNYTFKTPTNYNRTCEWISQSPSTRCDLLDENQIQVKDRCRASCHNCPILEPTHAIPTSIISSSSSSSLSSSYEQQQQSRKLQFKKQKVGQYCIQDSDCFSWLCRENVCFKSESCKSIKHVSGQEFHEKSINIVFVPSGFHDVDIWRYHVARTFRAFDSFEFFKFHNPRYNAFYVDEVHDPDNPSSSSSFCNFKCEGYNTLLCCDVKKARSLANKCFPTGSLLQIIVIENSVEYGGAGYRYQNLATTSIHPSGPLVAIHELGHSLFELGDEYESTQFNSRSAANCDVQGCPKWKDLSDHFEGDFCTVKGCENGDYYVGEYSFMRELDKPMGHVNLRYTCCTYLALTKGLPEYCKQYDFSAGLVEYCQNDYQGYGGSQVYREDGRTLDNDLSKGKYVVVNNPVRIYIDLAAEADSLFEYADSETFDEGPQLILRREFYGDFYHLQDVCQSHDVSRVLEAIIEFDTGYVKKLYFHDTDDVDVPPASETSVKVDIDASIETLVLEIVVDAAQGMVTSVQVKKLHITLWFRVRTWISSLFRGVFGWMFSSHMRDSSESSLEI